MSARNIEQRFSPAPANECACHLAEFMSELCSVQEQPIRTEKRSAEARTKKKEATGHKGTGLATQNFIGIFPHFISTIQLKCTLKTNTKLVSTDKVFFPIFISVNFAVMGSLIEDKMKVRIPFFKFLAEIL